MENGHKPLYENSEIGTKQRKGEMKMSELTKIRIKLKAYDHALLDKSAAKIVDTVKKTGAEVSGPIPLPRLCTLRSSQSTNTLPPMNSLKIELLTIRWSSSIVSKNLKNASSLRASAYSS